MAAPVTRGREDRIVHSRGRAPEAAVDERDDDGVVWALGEPAGRQLGAQEVLAGLEGTLLIEMLLELGLPACERACDLGARCVVERILPSLWEALA
jgi:hypothetical protein